MISRSVELKPGAGQMILSIASKHGMTFTAAIKELIDNSLDADASKVTIHYSPQKREFAIIDNGRGTGHVTDIVTPYKHREHATTASGRFGIGGTLAQIWLTAAQGKSEVRSLTEHLISTVSVDYGEIIKDDVLRGDYTQRPNESPETGTSIALSGCIDLNSQHFGSANRELSFLYTPTLREKTSIVFNIDGRVSQFKPYSRPEYVASTKIRFDIGRHRITGFCDLVKPGVPNMASGWAIAYGHRFMGKFRQPAGERMLDLGRIYSEVILPRKWDNISDHKSEFIEDPSELWAKIAEQCEPILNRIEEEGHVFEFDESIQVAQELIDSATGFSTLGIKGRRGGEHRKEGTVDPSGNGSPHRKFSKTQPGNKSSSLPKRIIATWDSALEFPYNVDPESRVIRVSISSRHPHNEKFRGKESGEFLASFILQSVAADSAVRTSKYMSMFPNVVADDIPRNFHEILSRLHAKENAG